MKPLVIYHGNCADGFTAAWVFYTNGDFDFYAGIYNDPPPDVTDRQVYLVDFSYERNVLIEMASKARDIYILDHHKTAQENLVDLPHNVFVTFDMNRSGAQIAWDYWHNGIHRPQLVNYVGDRDLWRFNLEGSKEVNAWIFAHEYTFDKWDDMDRTLSTPQGIQNAINMGAAIQLKLEKDVREFVATSVQWMTIDNFRVPVCNLPYFYVSEAGNYMCDCWFPEIEGQPPFAACYWDTPKGRVFSLRSIGDFDVSAIAKKFGGGGHKNSSGFRIQNIVGELAVSHG